MGRLRDDDVHGIYDSTVEVCVWGGGARLCCAPPPPSSRTALPARHCCTLWSPRCCCGAVATQLVGCVLHAFAQPLWVPALGSHLFWLTPAVALPGWWVFLCVRVRLSSCRPLQQVMEWGQDGLRTLVFAYRHIPEPEFLEWFARFSAAMGNLAQVCSPAARLPIPALSCQRPRAALAKSLLFGIACSGVFARVCVVIVFV
jgi:hypothetical protein